jgi:uncharacterized damage-inducible protein DinB
MNGGLLSAKETALAATLAAGRDLLTTLRALPVERHLWQPGHIAPSALAIAAHCASENQILAAALSEMPMPFRSQQEKDNFIAQCRTLRTAETLMNRSVAAVCDAIVALPDTKMTVATVLPSGERTTFAQMLPLAAAHLQYHIGQINYLQLLFGDANYYV